MDIHVRKVHKHFGSFKALDGVDLDIGSGELIALLGPSGSGKTTLLRVIAGLEFADQGAILFGGKDMARVPVRERGVGFVFQHYALFKHMKVIDNVSFGLRVRKHRPDKQAIRRRALELLDLVQLTGLENRYPAQLSGGQRQRVALARALAVEPRVLLLDEPFGALDAKVRKDLRRWLRQLHKELHITTIFVTHDQEEAMEVADRIVVMDGGKVAQVGTVDALYEQPVSPFVFEFLGSANVLPVQARGGEIFLLEDTSTPLATAAGHPDGMLTLYVRPGDLRIAPDDRPGLEVLVDSVQRTGLLVRADVRTVTGNAPLQVELPHLHHDVKTFVSGARLRLRLLQFSLYPQDSPRETQTAGGHELARAQAAHATYRPSRVGEQR